MSNNFANLSTATQKTQILAALERAAGAGCIVQPTSRPVLGGLTAEQVANVHRCTVDLAVTLLNALVADTNASVTPGTCVSNRVYSWVSNP